MHTNFFRNIKGNRNLKFLECDYLLMQWSVKLTLVPFHSLNCILAEVITYRFEEQKKRNKTIISWSDAVRLSISLWPLLNICPKIIF